MPADSEIAVNLELTPLQTNEQSEESQRLSLQTGIVPSAVAGYDVISCLGQGSFGTVWLSRERKTGKQVAIKFFTNRRGLDWTLLTREVEKLAVLDASNDVVRLLDVGWDHDPPYFVMEYLPNKSVAALLENGPIPIKHAIEMTKAIARALIHAHGAGILHCDIKPANVLIDRGEDARLGDFGQSRLSSDLSPALGTFYYMAPEQASMSAVPDVRWDVYAMGAVLYHMVTGEAPYRTEQTEAQLSRATKLEDRLELYRNLIYNSPFPSEHRLVPGIDKQLIEVIDRCLARKPEERIPNAHVVQDLLKKRELDQAKRPLFWLGILGPLVFILNLFWIGSWAVPNAVDQAEELLSKRALISDAATVQLLAASIDQELADRQAELVRLSKTLMPKDPDNVYEGMDGNLIEELDNWRFETDERMKQQGRTLDESVFVTDYKGTQIYRSPWTDTIGREFSYRDYFHGMGKELDPAVDDVRHVRIRTKPGVSLAFRSRNTGQYMVAIVVPIFDEHGEKGGNVIGILARTLHLTDLLTQWKKRINAGGSAPKNAALEDERLLSLIDMREARPYLLNHDWITDEANVVHLEDDVQLKELLILSEAEEAAVEKSLSETGNGLDNNYTDPLSDSFEEYNGRWLAAFANVGQVNWVAVVQEPRADAVQPMQILYKVFLEYSFILIVVFVTMLCLLWWLIRKFADVT